MNTKVFYSHGKLLLTGEYVVLDGAKALALPTNKGQYLSATQISDSKIIWRSYDVHRKIWFEDSITFQEIASGFKNDRNDISVTLLKILQTAKELNSDFLDSNQGYLVTTQLTFNRQFGLGSSSTLLANIAQWASVNPFTLLWKAFGGSGYDIACATANTPITYQLEEQTPTIEPIVFNPQFKNLLYFVYLNKKQSSKEAIKHYKTLHQEEKNKTILQLNQITKKIIDCNHLKDFNSLMNSHEETMSNLLQQKTCKKSLFPDYNKGCIKSLGAWGGDFVLVSIQTEEDLNYFRHKGYKTIFNYQEMILNS